MKIHAVKAHVDVGADMTKEIVAFHNFVKSDPKKLFFSSETIFKPMY
jgi:hypothetical protein